MPSTKVKRSSLLPADVLFIDKHMTFNQNLFGLIIIVQSSLIISLAVFPWCPPISPNPISPNPNSPNPYMLGLGIGLGLGLGIRSGIRLGSRLGLGIGLGMGLGIGSGSGFEYFRQYNVIR